MAQVDVDATHDILEGHANILPTIHKKLHDFIRLGKKVKEAKDSVKRVVGCPLL